MRSVLLVLCLPALACGARPPAKSDTPSPGVNDTGPCVQDTDCAVVATGHCGPCGEPCPNQAVLSAKADRYGPSSSCKADPEVDCEPCAEYVAHCLRGRCELRATGSGLPP